MKYFIIILFMCIGFSSKAQEKSILNDTINLDEVLVKATRISEKAPFTQSNLNKQEIEARNLGQDIPVLLNFLPNVVTTTDAGNGIGYTGIRVRGSDASRVNVTINGIPLNDSESHGVFWVNMPDFASSLHNIQLVLHL
jgi:iron complex outermembrane receptor protein